MATKFLRKSLLALGVQFWLAATAFGQLEDDYAPGRVGSGDMDLGAPADLSLYGNYPKPNYGWWGKVDGIYLWFDGPDTTTIGRSGFNPATFDGVRRIFQPNTLDTGWIDSDWSWGNRLEGGYMGDDDKGWLVSGFSTNTLTKSITAGFLPPVHVNQGIGVSFLPAVGPDGISLLEGFVDVNGDGFDDDINQNTVFGRDGIDTGTPNGNPPPPFIPPLDGIPDTAAATDFGDLVYFPVFFEQIRAENKTKTFNIEVMRVWRRSPFRRHWGMIEWFAGARYFNLNDKFNVDAIGGILNPADDEGDVTTNSYWYTEADNNLIGGQFGLRLTRKIHRLSFIGEGRGFIGANFQNYDIRGALGHGLTPGADNQPLDLGDTVFHDTEHAVQFAPGGELRVAVNYQVTRAIQFQAGWTGMYFNGLARASQSIDYRIPDMRIRTDDNDQDLFIQGVTFGVEVNR